MNIRAMRLQSTGKREQRRRQTATAPNTGTKEELRVVVHLSAVFVFVFHTCRRRHSFLLQLLIHGNMDGAYSHRPCMHTGHVASNSGVSHDTHMIRYYNSNRNEQPDRS